MIYRVLFDGIGIYESHGDVVLKDPSLSLELNSAGSFQFKMPPNHDYYAYVTPWVHDIEVYEGDELIFFGRPTNDISIDLYNNKAVYCEGGLAYFNDSIQRPQEWDSINLKTFVETLIANHNAQVPANRQFTLGYFPDEFLEKNVYRKLNYETTFECLSTMLFNAEGGFLMTRKVEGVQYLDWITDFEVSTQPVQFGLNIVNINQTSAKDDFFTSMIPLGPEVSGVSMTIKEANNGIDYLDLPDAAVYGRIFRVVDFSDAESPSDLLTKAQEYIQDLNLDSLSITVDAAELHFLDNNYSQLRIGNKVHVYSHPHNLEADLPILSMNLNLANAAKQVTIGTIERRPLSEIIGEYGQGYTGDANISFDPTPMAGSNRAVTSAGIFEAFGNLRFSINADKTVHVREVSDTGE